MQQIFQDNGFWTHSSFSMEDKAEEKESPVSDVYWAWNILNCVKTTKSAVCSNWVTMLFQIPDGNLLVEKNVTTWREAHLIACYSPLTSPQLIKTQVERTRNWWLQSIPSSHFSKTLFGFHIWSESSGALFKKLLDGLKMFSLRKQKLLLVLLLN